MGMIFAGHGGLDVEAAGESVEICAIPLDTSLQFYSDSGQILRVVPEDFGNIWAQLTAPWPALDATKVTYNLSLQTDDSWVELCRNGTIDAADFNGHQLVVPGFNAPAEVRLCTGTPYVFGDAGEVISGTCPTDPRQIEVGWTHTCGALLQQYAGQDLYWIACTSVLFADEGSPEQEAVLGAVGDRNAIIGLGTDPDQEKLSGTVSETMEVGDSIMGEIVDGYGNVYAFKVPADTGIELMDSVRFDGVPAEGAAFNVVKE